MSAARFAEIAMLLAQETSIQTLCELVVGLAVEMTACQHARIDSVGTCQKIETVAQRDDERVQSAAELCLRLNSGERQLGTLTLYTDQATGFASATRQRAVILAQHVSVALAALHEEEHLRVSISTRTVIGQAQGILMERYGISDDKAFAVLRRYSQVTNVKLLTVAENVIATRGLPESR